MPGEEIIKMKKLDVDKILLREELFLNKKVLVAKKYYARNLKYNILGPKGTCRIFGQI